ncbi:MAG: pseudouridine synthase [bacterium]|nr:pseudouridine synthase [bacterium]
MSFKRRISYFLVHTAKISNKEARELIISQSVSVAGKLLKENELIDDFSEIRVNGRLLREKTKMVYFKFNKPPGYECSLNEPVDNNLASFFPQNNHLSIAGRLDKSSRGLLLLSNNGKWVEQVCHPKFQKSKEYQVRLDRIPSEEFLQHFRKGVEIGGGTTLPCVCEVIHDSTIKVVLKEGKNRQIRRMCHHLGYRVVDLQRVRIENWRLENLTEGEFEEFAP